RRWRSAPAGSTGSCRSRRLPARARPCASRRRLPESIRVLVVDDHEVVREGLRTFLRLQEGIEVVGEAGDGEEAVAEAGRLTPDVVLMDLEMPRLGGVEALQRIRAARSDTRVIVLTSFGDDDKLMPAVRAGASGYLLKS